MIYHSFYFSEGVVAYSIPQGMVRGSMLELMDHTFDGHEDSLSGDLRGGLGQLVDGVYGWDNFKAARTNGHVKGNARIIINTFFVKSQQLKNYAFSEYGLIYKS